MNLIAIYKPVRIMHTYYSSTQGCRGRRCSKSSLVIQHAWGQPGLYKTLWQNNHKNRHPQSSPWNSYGMSVPSSQCYCLQNWSHCKGSLKYKRSHKMFLVPYQIIMEKLEVRGRRRFRSYTARERELNKNTRNDHSGRGAQLWEFTRKTRRMKLRTSRPTSESQETTH